MEFVERAQSQLQSSASDLRLQTWAENFLNETGYLNFRMRALVVSFYTHHLFQPWQNCSPHLAQQFLDFEPGIHYVLACRILESVKI